MSANELTRPFFIPEGVDWDTLPESHRVAITAVVQPVYDEYVLQATDALERSAGSSITSCLVMELLDQLEVGGLLLGREDAKDDGLGRERLYSRLMRTMTVKQKLTDGLMRLKNQRLKIATMDPFTARRVFGVRSPLNDAVDNVDSQVGHEHSDDSSEKCDENTNR